MRSCPKCGSNLLDDRDTFCNRCGCKLWQPILQPTESNSTSREAGPAKDVQNSIYQEQLASTPSVSTKANQPNPGQKSDKLTRYPIKLSINTNQFYMQGFNSVIHLKTKNLTDEPLNSVTIKVFGNVPIKNNLWHFKLGAGEAKERKFQLTSLECKGNELFQFEVTVKKGCTASMYETQATLCILERIEDAKEIELHTGNIDFGQESEKFNIGGVINIDVKNMIDKGQIKTANDLMCEYEKLLPAFCSLNVEFAGVERPSSVHRRWRPLLSVGIIALVIIALGIIATASFVGPSGEKKAQKAWQDALSARLKWQDLRISTSQDANIAYKKAEESLRMGGKSFDERAYSQAKDFFEDANQKFEKAKNIVGFKHSSDKEKAEAPEDGTAKLLDKARVYMNKGFLDGASKTVKQVLDLHSENEEAKQLLTEINEKIKQNQRRNTEKEEMDQWWKN